MPHKEVLMKLPKFLCVRGIRSRSRFSAVATLVALLAGGASLLPAATLCVNPGGSGGCMSTISGAVGAASPGDTIEVASGTYTGNIEIEMPLSLVAMPGAKPVIDATGQPNGIFINGMSAAPGIGVSGVVISGLEIENADFEGILVANASDVTLVGNYVHDNNTALNISAHVTTFPHLKRTKAKTAAREFT
jgi:nitrous oxidase accessory protein NosD